MNAIRELAGFLRWRLVPVRYAGKLARSLPGRSPGRLPPRSPAVAALAREGWVRAPAISDDVLFEIRDKYFGRAAGIVPVPGAHPFTSLFHLDDIAADDPLCRLTFSPELLDAVHDYFGGRFRYNSIQLMYSWPTEGGPEHSQLWHRDYGDSRSLHRVTYLSDVLDQDSGPFTFVDKAESARIGGAAIIRRIADDKFRRELGDGEIRQFFGHAGESVFVDPSQCYHYGSRCRRPRFAFFVTFSTDTPFTEATEFVVQGRERLIEAALQIRPDLSPDYLRAILTV